MKANYIFIFLCISLLPFLADAQRLTTPGDKIKGAASYYGPKFNGRKTASGEKFSTDSLTAAHPSLPFGSILKVTHLKTGICVCVRVNDRGPFVKSRIIDLSDKAAEKIGLIPYGVSKVEVELLCYGPAAEGMLEEIILNAMKNEVPYILPKEPFPSDRSAKNVQLELYLKQGR